jgi:hypothetical protein
VSSLEFIHGVVYLSVALLCFLGAAFNVRTLSTILHLSIGSTICAAMFILTVGAHSLLLALEWDATTVAIIVDVCLLLSLGGFILFRYLDAHTVSVRLSTAFLLIRFKYDRLRLKDGTVVDAGDTIVDTLLFALQGSGDEPPEGSKALRPEAVIPQRRESDK